MSQYSELSEMRITLDLLCSVIVSDVCASGTEEQCISNLLRENDSPWTDQEVRERIKEFAARKEQDGLELTVENLIFEAKLLGSNRLLRAIDECLRLTSTDAEFGAHDNLAISTIQQLQTELQLKNTAEGHWSAHGGWTVENQEPIKAADDGDHALDLDAAVRDLAEAIDVDDITGAIATGQDEAEIRVNIDETASTQATRSSGLVDRLIGYFVTALFLSFLIFIGISYDMVVGTIGLVVWFTSLFFSFLSSKKQQELWKKKLRARRYTPGEGFAIIDGVIELPPDADAFTCEWTRRKCVFYEFRLIEWRGRKGSGTDGDYGNYKEWVIFNDSKSVPFVVRSPYGTGTTRLTRVSPQNLEFKQIYDFANIRRLGAAALPKHNGTVVQKCAELVPGQHVTVAGQMSVDKEGGVFLGRVEFSTHSRPKFDAENSGASISRLPMLLLLGDLIPVLYFFWWMFNLT